MTDDGHANEYHAAMWWAYEHGRAILPPRCERQTGIDLRPPHRIRLCQRSAVRGSVYCEEHTHE